MPPVFEMYVKILHRIDAYYELIDNPLSPSEIAILGIPACEPLKSFVENRRAVQGGRIRWTELAALLNVACGPEICLEWLLGKLEGGCWPRLLRGPSDGWLGEEGCAELAQLLTTFTGNQACFFRLAEPPFIGADRPLVFKGKLNEACGLLREKTYIEYWWPCDRSWCVCSDYDLKFTIVGGPRTLISGLLRHGVLECIEVTPQTRVDSLAPVP